jgi:hypothetical protein
MLRQLSRVLDHSLATLDRSVNEHGTVSPQFDERAAAIRALRNPVKRKGALLLHQLVGHAPRAASLVQRQLLELQGVEQFAEGAEATVYRNHGSGVLKIYKRTWEMPETGREEFKHAHESSEAIMVRHLGGVVVQHAYDIGDHPINRERVVTANQPYVNFSAEDSIFPRPTASVDIERLAAIEQRHPGAVDELAEFATRSLAMHEATSYLPDTHGRDNLVIGTARSETPEVLIIDSYLSRFNNGHLPIHPHITMQLEGLIQAAAELH